MSAEPSELPKQDVEFKVAEDIVTPPLSFKRIVWLLLHPAKSVMVTECVPAARLSAVGELSPLLQE